MSAGIKGTIVDSKQHLGEEKEPLFRIPILHEIALAMTTEQHAKGENGTRIHPEKAKKSCYRARRVGCVSKIAAGRLPQGPRSNLDSSTHLIWMAFWALF